MKKEQLANLRDAIDAHLNGKPVQYLGVDGEWHATSELSISFGRGYRPKPEPKTRPWSKPDDVPGPVCWIRGFHHGGKRDYRMNLIVGFSDPTSYQTVSNGCMPVAVSSQFSDTRWEQMEYSTDRKTWHPCVVTED